MEQLLLHLIGDYILQNDWMAQNKKKGSWIGSIACQAHCIIYTIPFFLSTQDLLQIFLIYFTHYLIDRTNIVTKFLTLRNRE